ncbi:MAG TPA: hypothetical protein VLW51_01255 [Solirubrobacteraceae bacterium]|nr:hypothetical protein [Solirubrobacteraceae bacterium]
MRTALVALVLVAIVALATAATAGGDRTARRVNFPGVVNFPHAGAFIFVWVHLHPSRPELRRLPRRPAHFQPQAATRELVCRRLNPINASSSGVCSASSLGASWVRAPNAPARLS